MAYTLSFEECKTNSLVTLHSQNWECNIPMYIVSIGHSVFNLTLAQGLCGTCSMFSSRPFIIGATKRVSTLVLHWFLLEIAGFAKRAAFWSSREWCIAHHGQMDLSERGAPNRTPTYVKLRVSSIVLDLIYPLDVGSKTNIYIIQIWLPNTVVAWPYVHAMETEENECMPPSRCL